MPNFVPKLDNLYGGRRHVELTDLRDIREQLNSTASACWGAGTFLDLGYVQLCNPSPRSDEPMTTFVCKKAAYLEALNLKE